jgi:hypothetical protein
VNARTALTAYRIGFGALAVAAIGSQLFDLATRGRLDPLNFFIY